ncbi:helix-turn-helix domain-containing protein [Streptomyces sp. RPT161]|uniref:helix-turn-helix domain-containing protein n=1 Tax=Streptomyces sp. RPT161 TaxID=3015993 RepID=UPI0022B8F676|nr:helix-turn-helix domain-containing protein [Streptomyces sp. RPT161]
MITATMPRHRELQTFLQRCRDRVGISQKTMAERLHLSPRGYWNLEQGRIRNPSTEILDELAVILKLGARERWTLYMLAVRHDPPPLRSAPLEDASAFAELLAVQRCPAVVVDPAWQIVASNGAYRKLPLADVGQDSFMRQVLLTPQVRDTLLGDWDDAWAAPLLGELRTASEVHPDADWPKYLLRAITRDERLRRVWRRMDAHPLADAVITRPFCHPAWGPRVTVVETVPRYLTGHKIISLVPLEPQQATPPTVDHP